MQDSFGSRSVLKVGDQEYEIFRLDALSKAGFAVDMLPYSLRILLENLLRTEDGVAVSADDIRALAGWRPQSAPEREITFSPARVLLQDFTGVPAVVDLAAMRDAMADLGGDPKKINPLQPVELVIDHSIQVDAFARAEASSINEEHDYRRNQERYTFLKWGQEAFSNFQVSPPNAGICHQVNLEYLARVVFGLPGDGERTGARPQAFPDTLVGTDSHTPMVNGLGVLGWGVGGIEAEAAMLGQPVSMLIPQVIGFRLHGALPEGATATDLVLTVTELLRRKGVVGKFVEFYGPGIASLKLADRATIGNMSPEYGATCAIFPVDAVTLDYLRFTGRPPERIALVEAYMKEQGLFHTAQSPEPHFTDTLGLDLSTVRPSIAGPRRPQDRLLLAQAQAKFQEALPGLLPPTPPGQAQAATATAIANGRVDGQPFAIGHGAVVIAAITSCTNTSNPSVMLAAGLLAKKAVERGLSRPPWVKTSLAPGSRVVMDYYQRAGLTPYLEHLGFHLVGYGCTTCIGNSGPLPEEISTAVAEKGLVVASVLSGNRNFEGRINPEVRANYLMSPPLVVAFALAGRIDIDLEAEAVGTDRDGHPVYLREIWPSSEEINQVLGTAIESAMYHRTYDTIFQGEERWNALPAQGSEHYPWQGASTYVRRPPYFEGMLREEPELPTIRSARVLAMFGDSVTTDHISPAGNIKADSPAGRYLLAQGVAVRDFNSYGARRGNHEVMVRGTFANVRIRNHLVPGVEGGFTRYLPGNDILPIYDAAMRYWQDGIPLLVLAGKEYGSGSSRDWAAKGPYLQGVRLVIAESYERIHRSNLIGMGILPLQFRSGDSIVSLGLSGEETFEVLNLAEALANGDQQGKRVQVRVRRSNGEQFDFTACLRIDTPQETLYYRHGGILHYVLRQLLDNRGGRPRVAGAIAATAQASPEHTPGGVEADTGSQDSFPASDPPAY